MSSWKEFLNGLDVEWKLAKPTREDRITATENRLAHPLPEELKGLLLESNGVEDSLGAGVVWDLKRIEEDNIFLRTDPSMRELYMPFDSLLFFGDNGGGDQFAFARTGTGLNVYAWDNEDDSRICIASGLSQYLKRAVQGKDDPDWFRTV